MKSCSIENCKGIYKARGLCRTHYSRWLIHGDPNINLYKKNPICTYPECLNKSVARALCDKHYTRLRVNGDASITKIKVQESCNVEGCTNKHAALGFCNKHYTRYKKHGITEKIVKDKLPCVIENCKNKRVGNGYCNNHYRVWVRYKKPENWDGSLKIKKPVFEKLLDESKTNFSDVACWEWTGCLNEWGYGTVTYKGKKSVMVHRASFIHFRGEIPNGLLVCHHCDNPKCYNPNHLFLGTNLDNLRDCVQKGRHPTIKKVRDN